MRKSKHKTNKKTSSTSSALILDDEKKLLKAYSGELKTLEDKEKKTKEDYVRIVDLYKIIDEEQAKVKQATLNYITVQLAMSYYRSPNDRNKKKVIPLLEGLSKDIYKERDWVYSMAVMYHGLGKTEKSLELLHYKVV